MMRRRTDEVSLFSMVRLITNLLCLQLSNQYHRHPSSHRQLLFSMQNSVGFKLVADEPVAIGFMMLLAVDTAFDAAKATAVVELNCFDSCAPISLLNATGFGGYQLHGLHTCL